MTNPQPPDYGDDYRPEEEAYPGEAYGDDVYADGPPSDPITGYPLEPDPPSGQGVPADPITGHPAGQDPISGGPYSDADSGYEQGYDQSYQEGYVPPSEDMGTPMSEETDAGFAEEQYRDANFMPGDQLNYAEGQYDPNYQYDQQYAEGDYAAGQEVYAQPTGSRDSLAAMYVQKDEVKRDDRMTIQMGAPEKESKFDVFALVRGLIVLLIVVVPIGSLFFIKRPVINDVGQEHRVPLAQWLVKQITMTTEEREFQQLGEDERYFLVTKRRIGDVYEGVYQYYLTNGELPSSLEELADERLIGKRQVVDGWEREFYIEELNEEITVRSPGPDASVYTADDIVYDPSGLTVPSIFENLDIEMGLTGN